MGALINIICIIILALMFAAVLTGMQMLADEYFKTLDSDEDTCDDINDEDNKEMI